MNQVILIGRLTADPNVQRSASGTVFARYTLAVDRRSKDKNEADFINCVAFNKGAEFAEKYLRKGVKIGITGRLQTGSYEKNGTKIKTTDVVVFEHEFCESKREQAAPQAAPEDDFVTIPDDADLPFR